MCCSSISLVNPISCQQGEVTPELRKMKYRTTRILAIQIKVNINLSFAASIGNY